MIKSRPLLWAATLVVATLGVVTPSFASEESDALTRDLMTIVNVAEQRVWTIDHYEVESLMDDALLSVCVAQDAVRAAARAGLQAQIKAMGGPAQAVWTRTEGKGDTLDDLLTAERTLQTLDRAVTLSATHCTFRYPKATPFVERQRPTGRFFLTSEGGGLLNTRFGESELRMGGGGSGRVALGYGLNERWSLRIGGEFGGAGLLNQEFDAQEIDLDFYAAVPIVFRHRALLWHQDLDIAAVAMGAFWKETPRFAARLGGLFGLTYSRIGALQPWGGLRLGVEYAPGFGDDNDLLTVRVGLRFGVDLHL